MRSKPRRGRHTLATYRTCLVVLATCAAVLAAFCGPALADYQQDWVEHWDGSGSDDRGLEVVADVSGDVYVMAKSYNGSDNDYAVLKYGGDTHALLWERVYDRGDEDTPRGIAVGDGGVFVTGESWNGSDYDYLTLRLDASTGTVDWHKVYDNGRDDEAWGVAFNDLDGAIYVTGESKSLFNDDVRTIRYDSTSGALEWSKKYNGGLNDYATAVTVDEVGYVYVVGGTGRSLTGMNFLTILYNNMGTELWVEHRDGPGSIESDPDIAWDVATDGTTIYVTGQMNGFLEDLDYGTVAYRKSDGYEHWCELYEGAASGIDKARAVELADDGSVWVTGTVLNSSSWNQSCIATVQYSSSGSVLGEDVHCSGMSNATEEGRDVALDSSGRAWVAGRLMSPSYDYNYSLTSYDYGCSEVWSGTYDRDGADDDAYGVATSGDAVYVTGETASGDTDVTTAKFVYFEPVQEITTLEPSGGERWHVGTERVITWTSENVTDVKLEYTAEWGVPSPTWHTITASTPSDGSYTWEVPLIAGEPSGDCRIRVSDAADGDPSDVTDGSFEIYRFLVTRDGFEFANTTWHSTIDTMWASACWPDYNDALYAHWPFFDWDAVLEARMGATDPPMPGDSAFPSWPLFVEAFGESRCYFDPPPGDVVFRPSAVFYWLALPKLHWGSCFGFSISSSLVFNEQMPLGSVFPGYSELHDVPRGSCPDEDFDTARSFVNVYQTHEFGAQHVVHHANQLLTKQPSETLSDVQAILNDETRSHTAMAMWKGVGLEGHVVVPIDVEQDPVDPDVWYIHTYENFHPDGRLCRVKVDTSTETWTYLADGFIEGNWTGQGSRLFLMEPTSEYMDECLLPHELPGQVEILANPRVYGSFQSGSKSRGLIGDFTLYTSVMPLALEDDHWTCDFDSLSDGHFSWGVFTDQGNGLYYERADAAENEEEDMRYAGDGATATVLNPGPGTRTHSMTAVKAGTYEESVC
ncbi:MAG: hypothetical protein GF400_06260, partial [Candidatus Eisenbacteria bacterium]|nr:hypothetical protein [Candidatus Eisenbacteria bacterium]